MRSEFGSTQRAGGRPEPSLGFLAAYSPLVLHFELHGIERCSVVPIVGVSLCFEAGHRRWNNKHTAAETFRQWLLSDLHHKSLHRHPNRTISDTRARALTQMHMCPCTLHTLRKILSKHLFRATGNPNAVKPQSICVDPTLISSFLATYRGSTKL